MARFEPLESIRITSQITLGTDQYDGLPKRVGSFNFGVPLIWATIESFGLDICDERNQSRALLSYSYLGEHTVVASRRDYREQDHKCICILVRRRSHPIAILLTVGVNEREFTIQNVHCSRRVELIKAKIASGDSAYERGLSHGWVATEGHLQHVSSLL